MRIIARIIARRIIARTVVSSLATTTMLRKPCARISQRLPECPSKVFNPVLQTNPRDDKRSINMAPR